MRLSKVAKELNISIQRIGEFLESIGHEITVSPNTKLSDDLYDLLLNEFKSDLSQKQQSDEALEAKKQKEVRTAVSKDLESKGLNINTSSPTLTETQKVSVQEEEVPEFVKEVMPKELVSEDATPEEVAPKEVKQFLPESEKESHDVDVKIDNSGGTDRRKRRGRRLHA